MIGILLAAGFSRRFGAADKLMQTLPNRQVMALTAAQHLIAALPQSVAVVRAENHLLADALQQLGLQVVACAADANMMADSLVTAVGYAARLYPSNAGYVIALADMPYIQPTIISQVAAALRLHGGIVVPTFQGQRGHPVGFAAQFQTALMSVHGDAGARDIVKQHAEQVYSLACDDAGILADIDTPADMHALAEWANVAKFNLR